jgi:hypothetical protein
MRSTYTVPALLLLSLGTAIGPPSATAAVPTWVTTSEGGCIEAGYIRGGNVAAVQARVPDRFTIELLAGTGPARVRLFVNEVTCQTVQVDGHASYQRPTTTMILSAAIDAVDGRPADGSYVLSYATSNPALWARYRQLGWPAERLDPSSGVAIEILPDGATAATWTVSGGGWDHRTRIQATEQTTPITDSATYYYDGADERLTLTYDNAMLAGVGRLDGDLTGTPLAAVAFIPPVFTNFSGGFFRGGWEATLSVSR